MSERKVGVYICHCGGNISDYVDVDAVREAVEKELGVTVARTTMFTCSDASQTEIVRDIEDQGLDGMVVASCSPKLHLCTFRSVADRGGLNPFQYVQVNVREQCSWAHSDDREGATRKAIGLVLGGIEKAKRTDPLEPIRVTSVKRVLVIGGGVAGMRAAIEMADLGVDVHLVEREPELGGRVGRLGTVYPSGKGGEAIVAELSAQVARRERIHLWTGAEVTSKEGYIGNFDVRIRVRSAAGEEYTMLNVGAIITATGFDTYEPRPGESGAGLPGVMTLPEYEELVSGSEGELVHEGRKVRDVAFVYCVGSRQPREVENANRYCSRYCCNAAVGAALTTQRRHPGVRTWHLYRDIRTYGKFEPLYQQAQAGGALFCRFDPAEPPRVEESDGRLLVSLKDLLTGGEEIAIGADLVVLVTGMVPRRNEALTSILRLPIGEDGFYNEIHTKLRPVETVIDGVYIGGACQGPKNSTESIASSLSCVAKAAALLVKGYVDLQPFIAYVVEDRCAWCGACEKACPYSAIEKTVSGGKEVAVVRDVMCKGCGACLPVCPFDATQLKGYTDDQIESTIDAFAREASGV